VCAAGGDAVTTYVALIRGFSVYDGDTLTNVTLDLGWSVWLATQEIRINGVDAPELADARQRPAAAAVRDWLARRLDPLRGAGLRVVSEARDHDKYGRVLGDVAGGTMLSLRSDLLAAGLVKPYAGGAKPPWTDDELAAILVAAAAGKP